MKRKILFVFIIIFILLTLYWSKTILDINFYPNFTLSKTFPFKYLNDDLVLHPKSGEVIINEKFEKSNLLQRTWGTLWMREYGKVFKSYESNYFNNSKCLYIRSESKRDWAYSTPFYLKVQNGDVFSYKGTVKVTGKNTFAQISFASYDKDKKVILWNYGRTLIQESDSIQTISNRVIITDDISFIKFRLSGVGQGEFRFDDIQLIMEHSISELE